VIVARLASLLLLAALDRALRASGGLDQRYPGLEKRVATYHPLARALISTVVAVAGMIVLLQAWGLDSFGWFGRGEVGGRVLAASGTIVATLIAALAVWEITNAAIERHLARLARDAQLSRSARLRTLLPMLRTTLLMSVCVVAGLMVLSEIGVNIAPLLAGAGVIGLAIGFGSQKLVQDIITGLFLLLENAMQVGDVVSLGGMTGTVENLSIRTIRLRALDGAVHIVPFSAVTTVTNMTRDFGFAVLDVSLGLNEEPDHVADVLRGIATEMRTEKEWRGVILADLDVMGVERFTDLAWVMRVRMKTLPASRWAVGRELNRRIKYKFDALAIESPMTSFRALGMVTPLSGINTPPSVEIRTGP
jgi:small conductance mechanosensitive channel